MSLADLDILGVIVTGLLLPVTIGAGVSLIRSMQHSGHRRAVAQRRREEEELRKRGA